MMCNKAIIIWTFHKIFYKCWSTQTFCSFYPLHSRWIYLWNTKFLIQIFVTTWITLTNILKLFKDWFTFSFPFAQFVPFLAIPKDRFGDQSFALNLPSHGFTFVDVCEHSPSPLNWYDINIITFTFNICTYWCAILSFHFIKHHISACTNLMCIWIVVAIPFLLKWVSNKDAFFSFWIQILSSIHQVLEHRQYINMIHLVSTCKLLF